MMKNTYDILKELLEDYPLMYHNNNCSILLTKEEINAPGYYKVDLSNLDQVDEDYSGSVDFTYSIGTRGDVKVFEIFFGDDHNKDSHFNTVGYLAMTPYSLIEEVHAIADQHLLGKDLH